jgi:hypothetical protein
MILEDEKTVSEHRKVNFAGVKMILDNGKIVSGMDK